jgi:DNA-binding transcriptional ArsR family regulator
MISTVTALSALAQEWRLAAFRLLVQAGPGGLAAGEIAARLGLAPATLSFHLSQLERAGLVTSNRRGRRIIYAADFARMQGLMDFLTENCCGGGDAACAAPPALEHPRLGRSGRRATPS